MALYMGHEIAPRDFDGALKMLGELESGFAERTAPQLFRPDRNQRPEVQKVTEAIENFAQNKHSQELWLRAGKALRDVVQISTEKGDNVAKAEDLFELGFFYETSNQTFFQAAAIFEQAYKLAKACGARDIAFYCLGRLFRNLYYTHQYAQSCDDRAWARQIAERIDNIALDLAARFSAADGEPLRPDAFRVEEGEVGFSATVPMGASHVLDCLALALRNPETGKTALAHMDVMNVVGSLKDVFDRLAWRKDAPAFEARLIGLHSIFGPSPSNRTLARETLQFLDAHNVKILSAAIGSEIQPKSFVVTPETFALEEAAASMIHEDEGLAFSYPILQAEKTPLRIAFDLTTGVDRAPILLRRVEISRFRSDFLKKSPTEMTTWLLETTRCQNGELGAAVGQMMAMQHAYAIAHTKLLDVLTQAAKEKKANGINISDTTLAYAANLVSQAPLHIGENHALANEPLYAFIRSNLFVRPVMDLSSITVNEVGLAAFRFSGQALDGLNKDVSAEKTAQTPPKDVPVSSLDHFRLG